ncbi:hypothetical protein D3C86_1926860 [compost metagenome]
MLETLYQDLIFMPLLEDVADRILSEGAGGDQALLGTFQGHVCGCWHGCSPCLGVQDRHDPGALTLPMFIP